MALENIGRYQITGELGKGGMGVVYKATDPNIGRAVAIKTVRLDLDGVDGEQVLRRFKNEARAAGTLNHPNIVTIYDAGEQGGIFYIAMELVEGQTLEALLRRQRLLPIEQVIEIVRQVCAALDYAHEHSVVHRDVKPANVMLTPSGGVKVMDFGIARASTGVTTTGQVLGTPNYMSPEQVTGKCLDGRSDLFSVGVMLYEMLTGERPFDGQSITTIMYKIVNETPIPPLQLDVTLHPGLNVVVTRARSKSPHERYQSGAELVRDLLDYQSLATHTAAAQPLAPAAFSNDSPTVVLDAPPSVSIGTGQAAASAARQAYVTGAAAPATASEPTPAAGPVALPTPVPRKKGLSKWIIGAAVAVVVVGVAWLVIARRSTQAPSQTPPAAPSVEQQQQPGVAQPPPAVEPPPSPGAEISSAAAPPPVPQTAKPSGKSAKPAATVAKAVARPARPTPAAPAPATAATGNLRVTSTPTGAAIAIDGANQSGVTPMDVASLKAGPHSVVVSKAGYSAVERKVEIVADKQFSLDVQLARAGPMLAIQSDPPGAAILIDNKPTDKFTPAQIAISKGEHRIKLRLQGYADQTVPVRIADAQLYTIAPKLTPAKTSAIKRLFGGADTAEKMGTLAVESTPSGARLTLNNAAVAETTPAKLSVKEGKYQLAIVLQGYKTARRTVEVQRGKTLGIQETLERETK
jgi:serine/threonine-protein kinase